MSRLACAAVSTGAETFSELELSINSNSLNVSARALIRNKGKLLRVVVVIVVVVAIRRNKKKEEERVVVVVVVVVVGGVVVVVAVIRRDKTK